MRSPIGLYRVEGESMYPAYSPGDLVIGLRKGISLNPSQAVVVNHLGRMIVKRLISSDSSGMWLVGDNPLKSTDSRHFGPLKHEFFEAVIIARIARGR
jgi:nickel-type superoxide dismutase maturation protease